MRELRTAIATICWLVLGTASPLVRAQQYQNPIVRGMNPDPSIVRVGSTYYLSTSSFEYFPSCPLYESLDLVHWKLIGYALNRPEQFARLSSPHPDTYATTLRYHDGLFYLVTTDVHGGGNFLVTAKDPAGPWSDPVAIDKDMFDPSLLFDDDGKVFYTRRGPKNGENIVQAEIDVKTGALKSPLRTVSTGMITEDVEGPHLYKHDGWYYLSLAEGGSRFLHMETIGRSRSPWGPFEPSPSNPWASQHWAWSYPVRTVGHCDMVDTPDGAWWAVCLGTRHANYAQFSLGRETFLFPMTWQDGWPVVLRKNLTALEVTAGLPPSQTWRVPSARDDFAAPVLAGQWNTLGPGGQKLYSLIARAGFLRLHGTTESLSPGMDSAFVGRRQTEWKTSSTIRLEVEAAKEGSRAGLTVFMSPQYHYEIAILQRDHMDRVVLSKRVGDMTTENVGPALLGHSVQLRISSDAATYSFSYSTDGAVWTELGTGEQRLIASEVANVWTGAYLAMFAQDRDADFDWFEYQALP